MKTIAHVITGLEVGGAEQMLLAIATRLPPTEWQQRVYCLMGHGPIGAELERRGIPVTYLQHRYWRLYHGLRRDRPAILITYLIHADLLGRVIGRLAGVKTIIASKHGALLQWEWLKYLDRGSRWLVTHYIAVSHSLKNKLIADLHLPAANITVIPNGLDVDRYAVDPAVGQALRATLNIPPTANVIGTIANLRAGKGHADLLNAFHHLAPRYPDTRLLIVGDGDRRSALQKQVADLALINQVIFTGYRDDVPALLNVIDIFALPTYFEGMSMALLEAMAAGKPIVTTAIAENCELLVDQITAFLTPVGDIPALSAALQRLLDDPVLRQRLGQQAREVCRQHYDIATTTVAFTTVLNNLCR